MKALLRALTNSLSGLAFALRSERAVRQEFVVLALAAPLAVFIGGGIWQRVAMIALILLVIVAELLNTSLEKLCDHVTPDRHPHIKIVKDLASAAVLSALAMVALIWMAAILERLGFF